MYNDKKKNHNSVAHPSLFLWLRHCLCALDLSKKK